MAPARPLADNPVGRKDMATKAAGRPDRIDALRSPPGGWDFLWTEYVASCAESEAYGFGTVRIADARLARRIRQFPPFDGSAPQALDAERSRLLRQAAADYGEIQRRHSALVEETSSLHEALVPSPPPC
jgi:hypothetical protein